MPIQFPRVTIPYCIYELNFIVIVYLSYELFPSWDNGNSNKGPINYSYTSWPGTPKRTHTHRKKRQQDWGLLLEKEPQDHSNCIYPNGWTGWNRTQLYICFYYQDLLHCLAYSLAREENPLSQRRLLGVLTRDWYEDWWKAE